LLVGAAILMAYHKPLAPLLEYGLTGLGFVLIVAGLWLLKR
jgi:hypothetical protein